MLKPPTPYDWIPEIKPEIQQLDSIPLLGAAPSFPWQKLAERLAQTFEKELIRIEPETFTWRAKDQLYEGLGDALVPLHFSIPSLAGTACWVMPQQEITSLESLLLTKENHPLHIYDTRLTQAFYRFLTLEILYHISQLGADKTLAPVLINQETLPQEDSLCLDISVVIQSHPLWGRLIISPDLRQSWVEHFAKKGYVSPLSQKLAQQIEVPLHVEIGRTQLNLKQLSTVQLGDWIALDVFTLDPETFEGPLVLSIDGKSAFRGQLENGQIEIEELASFQEAEIPMAKDIEDDEGEEHEEDDFSDLDDLEDEDLDLDESFDLDEEEEAEHPEENAKAAPVKPAPPPKEEAKRAPSAAAEPLSHQLSARDILVSLVVEIGQVRMTMDKLLSLEPGNLLDLNIRPEDGVNLIVNGKTIGKGELVRMGESIGVRILELGTQTS